jgi:hypothetical protein
MMMNRPLQKKWMIVPLLLVPLLFMSCGGGGSSGGGWRLPDIKELASSVDSQVYLPSNWGYWSPTSGGIAAWFAGIGFGSVCISTEDKINTPLYTRCVRWGISYFGLRIFDFGSIANH